MRTAVLAPVLCLAAVTLAWSAPGDTAPVGGEKEPGLVVETDAYYVQTLSDFGGHRRLVRASGEPATYVAFMTVGGRLEYRTSTDMGRTWQGGRANTLGPSLQCGISTWLDARDDLYVLYDDTRNTLTMRRLTRRADGTWKIGEKGNAGRSLAQFRAYMHSAICREPGRDGRLWAVWWEHGEEGGKTGTIKRLRAARSTDPDGTGEWSAPMDPVPADVPVIENETLACTLVLLDGRPALFVYQGFYGRTGLCRWDGTRWTFEEVDLHRGLSKRDFAHYTTYSVAVDDGGTLHLVWNAPAREGGVFYKQLKDGGWSDTTVISTRPQDRWPTLTLADGTGPVVIWCRPVADAKDYKVPHDIVGKVMRDGKWDEKETLLVRDDRARDDASFMFPNTATTSGARVMFLYSRGTFEAGGRRSLRSGVFDTTVK